MAADDDLQRRKKEAAKMVADQAKVNAGALSRRLPGAIKVRQYQDYTEVVAVGNEAPMAAPFEQPLRHPLFGSLTGDKASRKRYENGWYAQPHRPFMQAALDSKGDEATDHIGDVVDDWGEDSGFNED